MTAAVTGDALRARLAAASGDALFLPAEAAEILRVSTVTVARWACTGRIASARTPGGYWRIPAWEIRGILEGSRS